VRIEGVVKEIRIAGGHDQHRYRSDAHGRRWGVT
jgi:hypothetical protein